MTEDIRLTDSGNVIIDNDGAGVDSDPDGDALLVLEITGGQHGGLVWAGDGSYSYTLDNSDRRCWPLFQARPSTMSSATP